MDYFNIDPDEHLLPPNEVRFLSLTAEPYPDGHRVHVTLQLTPFQQPPCLELTLVDSQGIDAGSVSIIEPPHRNEEITMHIRNTIKASGYLILTARVYYPENEDQDKRSIEIMIPDISEDLH
jgi:hypothetical protein